MQVNFDEENDFSAAEQRKRIDELSSDNKQLKDDRDALGAELKRLEVQMAGLRST